MYETLWLLFVSIWAFRSKPWLRASVVYQSWFQMSFGIFDLNWQVRMCFGNCVIFLSFGSLYDDRNFQNLLNVIKQKVLSAVLWDIGISRNSANNVRQKQKLSRRLFWSCLRGKYIFASLLVAAFGVFGGYRSKYRFHPKIPKPKIPKPKIPNVQNTQSPNIPKIEIAIPIK